jgi:hypothetical protein
MSWDIQPGNEESYFEFHIRKFVPTLDAIGLTLNEAWLTQYGNQPRMTAEAVMPSMAKAQQILASNEWEKLCSQLDDFVENFTFKVIPARGGLQM